MFERHLIIDNDKEKSLYLFVNFNYEFSRELGSKEKGEQTKSLYEKVIDYIKNNKIDFKAGRVFLVVGGIVIGALFFQNYQPSDIKNNLEPNYKYVEQIDIFNDDTLKDNIFKAKLDDSIANKESTNKVISEAPLKTDTKTNYNNQEIKTTSPNNVFTKTSQPSLTQTPPPTTTHETTQPTTTQETTTTPSLPPIEENFITLYRSTGTVEEIALEDYVIGVVGAEMPASFSIEALKAQSVVARTYALKKVSNNQVLSDTTSTQVYKDVGQLKALWGSSFNTYYNKIKEAVNATKNQHLTYGGNYIEAVYHSTSNGRTEDAVSVWGNSFPYLISVDSHWDLQASSYLREVEKESSLLSSILGIDFTDSTSIKVLSRTASNRIDRIEIDGNIYTGTNLRNLLGLRSTDFDINIEDNNIVFTTRGYGHGVGMSQYGANGMAKEGYNYEQILAHYYPKTQLKK